MGHFFFWRPLSAKQRWLFGFLALIALLFVFFLLLLPAPTQAKSSYLAAANATYPNISGTKLDGCTLCHTGTPSENTLNSYATDYRSHSHDFSAIEGLDSDGDGFTNLAEIQALTFPGDAADPPGSPTAEPTATISPNTGDFFVYLPLVLKGFPELPTPTPNPTSPPPTATPPTPGATPPPPGSIPPPAGMGNPPAGNGQYTIIAWNDLGMHCMDPSFEDFAVLPPFNTLWAQVVRRGHEPDIVTNVTVEYRVLSNTESASKTNFWDYAQQLFGLAQPLAQNIGLKGFGLSGEMEPAGDHYVAEGIPLTEYRDDYPNTPYPYQVAEVIARDSAGNILASTQTVIPVSTELHCEYCHDDGGQANPNIATGKVKQNILTLHDREEGTDLMAQRPVLCAGCHSSNALGTSGQAGLGSLSHVIHSKHQSIDDGTMEGTCYSCHPGPSTSCLRGTMAAAGETCQSCHGNMADVANPARNPWFDMPRCGQCHDSAHSENPGTLYRFSRGHEGIYCQACHGSQHAIYPTNTENDNVQSILLQGHAGTIDTCTVCHTNNPDRNEGPHHGDDGGDDDHITLSATSGINPASLPPVLLDIEP